MILYKQFGKKEGEFMIYSRLEITEKADKQFCLCIPCSVTGNCACDNTGYCNGNYVMLSADEYTKAIKKGR